MKEKAKGLLEAVPLVEFLGNRKEKERYMHNSLLQQAIQAKDNSDLLWGSGLDPPTISDHPTAEQTTKTVEWGRNQLTPTEMLCLITG
jgi:hypothetical protein